MIQDKTVLSVKKLTKVFANFTAVKSVSFSIKKGEIVGLLGPNGAGKTTTIQMLLGLMKPTSGDIRFFGKSMALNRTEILGKINYMSGYGKMPWSLTVHENLRVFCHLYSIVHGEEKILTLANRFQMTDLLSKRFLDLSAGQATRVSLAKSFLNDPELVLLDEPTASLDPDIAYLIREFIIAMRKTHKTSILITSHNMKEVEELCDRVIFMNQGRVFATGTPKQLAKTFTHCEVSLYVSDGLKRVQSILLTMGLDSKATRRFITVTMEEEKIPDFLHALSSRGVSYQDISIDKPSLEDYFLSVSTKREVDNVS